MLVAADGHQQEVAHIFQIFEKVQKNEASRPKKLKFNETKDFWKSCLLGPP